MAGGRQLSNSYNLIQAGTPYKIHYSVRAQNPHSSSRWVRCRTYFHFLWVYTWSRYLPFETTANAHQEALWQHLRIFHLTERAEPHGLPYCSDPNCVTCEELREVQEAIRLHQPIPIRKLA